MQRLTVNETEVSAILKLSDNNPDAVFALTRLVDKSRNLVEGDNTIVTRNLIDDIDLNGIRLLTALDNMEMYGEDIAEFYVNSCGGDPEMFLYFIRSIIDDKIKQLHPWPTGGSGFWKAIPISGTSAIRSLYKT